MDQATKNELTDLTIKMLKLDSLLKKHAQEREACKLRYLELNGGENFSCDKGAVEVAPLYKRTHDEKWFQENLSAEAKQALSRLDLSDGALKAAAQEGHFKYSEAAAHVTTELTGYRVTVKPAK